MQPNAFEPNAGPHDQPDRKRDNPSPRSNPPPTDPDNPRPRRDEPGPDSPRRPEDIPDQKMTEQKPVSTAKPHIHAPVDNPAWSHRVGENPEEAGEEQRERKARRSLQKDGA